jgi:hypothetical protein
MPLSPEEKRTLETMALEVHEMHADMADLKAKVIQHGADIRSHQTRLDRHDYRIGTLEYHVGIGPVGSPATNPMVDPLRHRARIPPLSLPPKSAEELGLRPTDTGSAWRTDDVGAILRRFEEQEQQRLGAETALELERKRFDRRLKIVGAVAALVVLVVGSGVAAITFVYTHVSVAPKVEGSHP